MAEIVCGGLEDPVVCSASSYDGNPLAGERVVMGWGSNTCSGRQALYAAACAAKLLPSRLEQVQCVPDASGGHCPPKVVDCAPDPVAASCTAGVYDGQAMLAVPAWPNKSFFSWSANAI